MSHEKINKIKKVNFENNYDFINLDNSTENLKYTPNNITFNKSKTIVECVKKDSQINLSQLK